MKQETILEKRRRQSDRIRQMTVAAMLSAITALLVFTPIGMIQLPPPLLAVTTVHVPVLIAALVEGWWVGGFVGLVFGVCSLIRAWESGAVGLTLFFRNPLISVLPRILFPLGAYAVYLLLKKLFRDGQVRDQIAAGIAAAVGAVLNTVLVLGTLYLIYGAKLTELVNNMISAWKCGGSLSGSRGRVAGGGSRSAQRHCRGRCSRASGAHGQSGGGRRYQA